MNPNMTRYGKGHIVNHAVPSSVIKKDQVWIGRNHEVAVVTHVDDHVHFTLDGKGPFLLSHSTFLSCASLYIPDSTALRSA